MMSFILDALKKSDHKRQETSAPRLDTVHDPTPAQKRRRPLLIGLVLLVVLVNGGVLLWFLLTTPEAGDQRTVAAVAPVNSTSSRAALPLCLNVAITCSRNPHVAQ